MSPATRRTDRHLLGALGVAVATVGLGLAAGPEGVAAGLAAGVAWYLLPAAYAFAAGQVLAVVALSPGADPVAVAAAEAGLLAVLAGPLSATSEPARTLAAFAVAALVVGAAGWAVLGADRPLWLAVLAAAVVAAVAAYGIHRVERVRLGLVEDGPADGRGRTSADPAPEETTEGVR